MSKPQSNTMPTFRMAWNFSKVNDDTTEIFVYDAIVDKQRANWSTGEKEGVSPISFNEELRKVTTQNICVRINSRGGDVFAAEAIRTAIRELRAEGKTVTCKVDGFCGSAAVGISAACETTAIPSSAWFMIHDPYIFTFGYYGIPELKKDITMLEKIKQGIINAYAEKTGKGKEEISDLMTAETWYTGEEAVENGFCDEVMFVEETEGEDSEGNPENMSFPEISMYKNVPTVLLNSRPPAAAVKHIQNQTKNQKGVNESMEIKNVEDLRAAHPQLAAQIADTAAAAERKRIQDIENIALPGFEGVINKAKFETPTATAADVAVNIIAEQRKQGAAYLENVNEDVKNSGAGDVAPQGHEGGKESTDPYLAAIDSEMPKGTN